MARQRTSVGMLHWLGLAFLFLLLDQISKVLILSYYQLGDSTPVLSWLNIVRVHNAGAAFSFLADASGWQRWFFVAVGALATIFILFMLRSHAGQRLFCFSMSCILGGAIGNVLDRLLHGHVIDFIDFHIQTWHFPAFNLADSAISLGAFCLILDEVLRVRRSRA
ncbi:MAG: signal peptidase II [Hylemonella sp.]|jgi:signal peptidase II